MAFHWPVNPMDDRPKESRLMSCPACKTVPDEWIDCGASNGVHWWECPRCGGTVGINVRDIEREGDGAE